MGAHQQQKNPKERKLQLLCQQSWAFTWIVSMREQKRSLAAGPCGKWLNYWKLLKTTENYWKLLKTIETYWKLLKTTENYWSFRTFHSTILLWKNFKIFETIENYWKLLKTIENYWKLLKTTENYWKLLKSIENHQSIYRKGLKDTFLGCCFWVPCT